ncbi:hypothetical protein RRF57_005235 [Xylaria bambusicola]|uniref:Uncharacterized protein n=1 Tax=Xylaria bambusicola TaxID=326684 RepID=A0AAN7UBX5_9PEZI
MSASYQAVLGSWQVVGVSGSGDLIAMCQMTNHQTPAKSLCSVGVAVTMQASTRSSGCPAPMAGREALHVYPRLYQLPT